MTGPTDLTVRVGRAGRRTPLPDRLTDPENPGVERTNMALVMRQLVGPRTAPLLTGWPDERLRRSQWIPAFVRNDDAIPTGANTLDLECNRGSRMAS